VLEQGDHPVVNGYIYPVAKLYGNRMVAAGIEMVGSMHMAS
jgi:hypothetical protein